MCFGVHYGAALTIGADAAGLWMKPTFIFAVAQPALLVPWSEVIKVETSGAWIFRRACYLLGSREKIPLSISERLDNES